MLWLVDVSESLKTHRIDLDAAFPHTRRIAYDRGAPMWGMGWVKLEPLPPKGER